ncbi:MAG: hypothetical protein RLZ75_407, partial [Pseudomonadota bacterium]
ASTTYYVSSYGNDNNNGTSLSTPVRTITNALRKAKSNGDIIYVMTGTYVETVSIGQSGISLSAYPGNKPVIDGSSFLPNLNWGVLLSVRGNYNKISGFEIKNSNITGRYASGRGMEVTGQHNTISNMNVHHTWGGGILVRGDYNIVEDSRVWQNCLNNSTHPGAQGWGTGMSAAQGASSSLKPGVTSYVTLRRNTVFNNWGEGLSCYEADHCILEDNIVYDNWSVNLYISDTTNSLVQRNMIYVSSNPAVPARGLNADRKEGIVMADEKADKPRSVSNTIINNLIYNSNFEAFQWTLVPNSGLKNVLIANNTIVDGSFYTGAGGKNSITNSSSRINNNIITGRNSRVSSKLGLTFSYNNWLVTPLLAKSSTDIIADPQIAETGKTLSGSLTPDYFKLLGSSPLIGAGIVQSSITEDFFKSPRRGLVTDIGAHIYQATTGTYFTTAALGSVTNIAPLASVTASSQNLATDQPAIAVTDGVVEGWPGNYTKEWVTVKGLDGSWVELNWTNDYRVNQVVLYDRPNLTDQITSLTLTFSDGTTITSGALENSGERVAINFTPLLTHSVKVTATTVSGTTVNVGLSEIEVYGG